VDNKKITTNIGVINDCRQEFKARRNFIAFLDIFRSAGATREAGVLTQLLHRYELAGVNRGVKSLVALFEMLMLQKSTE
jgi:hypothetical protein